MTLSIISNITGFDRIFCDNEFYNNYTPYGVKQNPEIYDIIIKI